MKKKYVYKTAYGDFRTGDIGLSKTSGFVPAAIRFLTSWHTSSASRNHAYIYQSKNIIVEALLKITTSPSSKYQSGDIVIYRIPLTAAERHALESGLLERINGAYGFGKLLLFAGDSIATKFLSLFGRKKPVFFFTRYFGITNIPVCSQLVVWTLYKFTSYRLKDIEGNIVPWRIISPDYLEDLLEMDINKAVKIYEQDIVDIDNA